MQSDLYARVLALLKKHEHCAALDEFGSHCQSCDNRVGKHWAFRQSEPHKTDCEWAAIVSKLEVETISEKHKWSYSLYSRFDRGLYDSHSHGTGTGETLADALRGIDANCYRVICIYGNCTPEELAAAKVDPVLRKWFE